MLTPAIVVEILKSSWVICRAQPPFWIRFGSKIERRPELRHAVDVGRRRVEERGLVAGKAGVLRPRVGERLGVGDVDRPLSGLIGVAECAVRRNGCRRGENATCHAGTENCASR